MLKTRKVVVLLFVSLALVGILLYYPKAVIKTIPTASPVTVEKLEYNETAKVTGSIVKNRDGDYLIQVFVGEREISSVKIGQPAEITGDAFPDKIYYGEVSSIAETASKIQFGNITRTMIEVTILVKNPDEFLKPGYTARVSIQTSDKAVLTILPYEAINQDESGEYVYVISDGVAAKKYIETCRELSQGVEVAGITAEDTVIIADKAGIEGKSVIVS